MSSFRDSPMEAQLSHPDVILNRVNVALARSQRVMQSWLPANTTTEEESTGQPRDDDDEEFAGLDELGGVGSKRKADDEGLLDGAFKRKKLASNDKLLEQLLGKKALQARKKGQEPSRGMAGSGHAAPKQMPVKARPGDVDSDEEEEGRATAFKSKKSRARPEPAPAVKLEQEEELDGDEEQPVQAAAHVGATATKDDAEEEQRPSKKRAGSYLDEVLGQNANKKSKKKKHKASFTAQ